MKITKRQLRKIIRENVDGFSGRLAMTNGIRDAIVGYLEERNAFGELGEIPQFILRRIEHSALVIVDDVLTATESAGD